MTTGDSALISALRCVCVCVCVLRVVVYQQDTRRRDLETTGQERDRSLYVGKAGNGFCSYFLTNMWKIHYVTDVTKHGHLNSACSVVGCPDAPARTLSRCAPRGQRPASRGVRAKLLASLGSRHWQPPTGTHIRVPAHFPHLCEG